MKKRALRKDFFMEIRRNKGRFISIFLIVALGVAFYSGIQSAAPDMRYTGDSYFDGTHLMDLQVQGSQGMTGEDVKALEALESVEKAEPGYSVDVLLRKDGDSHVLHVSSLLPTMNQVDVREGRMPQKAGECLIDARYAENHGYRPGDVLTVEEQLEEDEDPALMTHAYEVTGIASTSRYVSLERGSTTLGSGEIDAFLYVPQDTFDLEVYTEVCLAVRGAAAETAYLDAYEELVGRAEEEIETIKDERCQARGREVKKEAGEKIEDARKELADKRAEADEKLADAQAEIEDAERKLADGRQELADGRKEIADGRKTLEEKKAELEDGKAELADGRKKLADARVQLTQKEKEFQEQKAAAEKKLAKGEKQIARAKRKIAKNEKLLETKKKELADGKKTYLQSKETLDASKKELADSREQLTQSKRQLEEQQKDYESGVSRYQQGKAAVEEEERKLEAALGAGLITEEEAAAVRRELAQKAAGLEAVAQQLEAGREQLENGRQQLAGGERQLQTAEQQLKSGEAELAAVEQQLSEGEKQLEAGKKEIAAGKSELSAQEEKLKASRQQLADGEQKIKDGWTEISAQERKLADAQAQITSGEKQLQDAEKELADGEKELKDGEEELAGYEKDLAEGKQKYEDAKAEADEKIADGEQKIADAQEEVDGLKAPKWYISDRDDLPGYKGLGENADRMRNIGQVFPVLFFLVAALISLTTMTRMVEEQRTQIGTFKALGYSKASIAGKYLGYALIATIGGSVCGVLLGEKLLPFIIIHAYGILYTYMPIPAIPYNLTYALIASLAAVFCTLAATLSACYRELAAAPAVLMRPPAPKQGKRVSLERVTILWNHLSFTWKSTIRNLFRYKKRLFMTVFGIGGCMALLLVGFGLRDSIMDVAVLQYGELQTYDAMVLLDEDADENQKQELYDFLDQEPQVSLYDNWYMKNLTAKSGDGRQELYLVIPQGTEKFPSFVRLQDRRTKEGYTLSEEGIVLTEKMARLLDVSEGDSISLELDEGEWYDVTIAAICENYMYHYVYMTPGVYEKLTGSAPEYGTVVYDAGGTAGEEQSGLGQKILSYDAALGITYTSGFRARLDEMLETLDSVIYVLIISAGLLAFVVLYNLNNININERKRELATIKVLGFYDGEVAAYVYRENVLLTIIGAGLGCVLGIILHRFVILTVEVEMCMFGRNINLPSFLLAVLFTVGFSVVVNFVMYFKLKKIDMVESLKSVE